MWSPIQIIAKASGRAFMKIEILGANDINRLPGLSDASASVAARYVAALVRAGPRFYVDNADVAMKALVIDGKALPLVINRGAIGNAHVCSPSAHYVDYTLEEVAKRHRPVPLWLLKAMALPVRAALAGMAINKAVMVNNWLFPTNPTPGLSSPQIAALTAQLATAHPDCAIVFPSVNPVIDRAGFDALRENGYKLVRSRRVYVLDAGNRHPGHRDLIRDLRLLTDTPYEIVGGQEALEAHAPRLAALYRDLYVVKHSRLNPQFNARFISLTLKEDVFTYRALAKDGRIDAFIGYFSEGGVMTGAIMGYDQGLPRRLALYRLGFAILLAEGLRQGLLVNLSAGAGEFKMLRGAVPVEEFDAVYDDHLPAHRRAAWTTLRLGGEWAASRKSRFRGQRRRG
jgi:hypothetical protein